MYIYIYIADLLVPVFSVGGTARAAVRESEEGDGGREGGRKRDHQMEGGRESLEEKERGRETMRVSE
jgi:hypothetical protein